MGKECPQRLFILSRTPLRPLLDRATIQSGDRVAFFRDGQDIDGGAQAAMTAAGISVIAAETLVGAGEALDIERHFQSALFCWTHSGGRDATLVDGFSFGYLISPYIKIRYSFFVLVRVGLIFDRLLAGLPAGSVVLTDIIDGINVYSDGTGQPEIMQWRSLLGELAAGYGVTVADLPRTDDALVSIFRPPTRFSLWHVGRPLLAGLRPRRVLGRWRLFWRREPRRRIYLFSLGNNIGLLRGLAGEPRLQVITDVSPEPGIATVSPAHLWVIPELSLLRGAWRTCRHIDRLAREQWRDPAMVFGGIDFAPALLRALVSLKCHLPVFMIIVAQVRALLRRVCPAAVVTSGDYLPATLATFDLGRRQGFASYFINHGYDLAPCTLYASEMADRSAVYVAEGSEIAGIYGFHMPEADKPRRPVVTTPAMIPMLAVRGTRKPVRRLLVTGYSSYTPHAITRTGYYDRYMIDVILTAKRLRQEGITTVYRPHPGEVRAYFHDMVARLDGGGAIELDTSPSFAAALAGADVFVCNATTCYYQALFAGWPTIFYEPGYDPRFFIGLPSAEETGRPLAKTADELLTLIRAAYDPTSSVARFPDIFNGPLAARYMGQSPERADEVLSAFFLAELGMTGAR